MYSAVSRQVDDVIAQKTSVTHLTATLVPTFYAQQEPPALILHKRTHSSKAEKNRKEAPTGTGINMAIN